VRAPTWTGMSTNSCRVQPTMPVPGKHKEPSRPQPAGPFPGVNPMPALRQRLAHLIGLRAADDAPEPTMTVPYIPEPGLP
jgi:hypothetical protein